MGRKKLKKLKKAARQRRRLEKLMRRGQSEYCEVRSSSIHGTGVYASQPIPKGTQIIEYVGERIDKEESEQRALRQLEQAERTGEAAVYIFTLSKRWDVDGNFPWNTARLLNHSCDPNCETWIEGKRIFVYALRDIAAGEELTFDYGFDIESYEDHPCRCGSECCVGYIVNREQWPQLRSLLAGKNGRNGSRNESPPAGETKNGRKQK